MNFINIHFSFSTMKISRLLPFALLLLCVLCVPYPAHAQSPPQGTPAKTSSEIQAPFDKDGKLWIITEEMERQYGFFPKYRNVIDARLFQLPDSSFVLDLTQLVGSVPENTRIPLSLVELVNLRNAVSDALQRGQMSQPQGNSYYGGGNFARQLDERTLGDWEKTSLVIGATTLGLSYGLLADGISFADGVANPRFLLPSTYIMTVATPIAFGLGTYWAVSQPWFTRLSSLMLLNGISSGFAHGLAGYFLVADQKQADGRTFGISGILGSLIESGLTLRLPETLNLNYGQTSLLTNMGSSTILTGALAAVALGAFNPDSQGNINSNALRLTAAASLLGSAGGYFLGYRLGQSQNIAPGDAIVFEAPSSLVLLPAFTLLLPQTTQATPDVRLFAGLTAGAQVLGYVLGNELIRNKDFTFDQGRQINQMMSLGVTLGLIPLYAGLNGDAARYAPLLMAAGGAIGFTIAYANCSKQAELYDKARRGSTDAQSLLPEEVPESRTHSWFESLAQHIDVQFSPLGMAGVVHPALSLIGVNTPIVSIRTQLGAMERENEEWQREAMKQDILRQQTQMR
jgi:hypothetical protein